MQIHTANFRIQRFHTHRTLDFVLMLKPDSNIRKADSRMLKQELEAQEELRKSQLSLIHRSENKTITEGSEN